MKDPGGSHMTTNQLAQLIQYQLDLSSRTELNSGLWLRFQVGRWIQQVGGESDS